MKNISVKLPQRLLTALEAEARTCGVSKSQIVRECIEQRLFAKGRQGESVLDRARGMAGVLKGLPRDLAVNPKRLRGFGE